MIRKHHVHTEHQMVITSVKCAEILKRLLDNLLTIKKMIVNQNREGALMRANLHLNRSPVHCIDSCWETSSGEIGVLHMMRDQKKHVALKKSSYCYVDTLQ